MINRLGCWHEEKATEEFVNKGGELYVSTPGDELRKTKSYELLIDVILERSSLWFRESQE